MAKIIWKKNKDNVFFGIGAPFFIIFQDFITGKWNLEVRYKFKKTYTTIELDSIEECKTRAEEFREVAERG